MPVTYRSGYVGALMDEYERAARELLAVIERLDDTQYVTLRDAMTEDDNCRSIQTVMSHVVRACFGYADMLNEVWGRPKNPQGRQLLERDEALAGLRAGLQYTLATVDGHKDLTEAQGTAIHMQSSWGQEYDFDQLFEHAIMHLHRHRRQIERWLAEAT
jgi:uncharacterized damage-inducible protein DinB